MMSPFDYEKRIIAMVDSFTKTVARNFSRNLKQAKANREKPFSDEPIDYDDNVYCKYYEVVYILFHTGMRISEFCGLTLKHQGMREWWTDIQDFCLRIKKGFPWWRCIGSIDLTIW